MRRYYLLTYSKPDPANPSDRLRDKLSKGSFSAKDDESARKRMKKICQIEDATPMRLYRIETTIVPLKKKSKNK